LSSLKVVEGLTKFQDNDPHISDLSHQDQSNEDSSKPALHNGDRAKAVLFEGDHPVLLNRKFPTKESSHQQSHLLPKENLLRQRGGGRAEALDAGSHRPLRKRRWWRRRRRRQHRQHINSRLLLLQLDDEDGLFLSTTNWRPSNTSPGKVFRFPSDLWPALKARTRPNS